MIAELTDGPVILVGSSMGGWISLLLSKRLGARLVGLVTIAAAPDFTEDTIWASFDTHPVQISGRSLAYLQARRHRRFVQMRLKKAPNI